MKDNKVRVIISVIIMCLLLFVVFKCSDDKELQKEVVEQITNTVTEMATYEMSETEIKELPTTKIEEQTEEQEKEVGEEQATTETEGFEEQGEIAYNGASEYPNVLVGDYKGLTYYSQIDNRWKNHSYTSTGNASQTIGSSGCRTYLCSNGCNSYKRNNITCRYAEICLSNMVSEVLIMALIFLLLGLLLTHLILDIPKHIN